MDRFEWWIWSDDKRELAEGSPKTQDLGVVINWLKNSDLPVGNYHIAQRYKDNTDKYCVQFEVVKDGDVLTIPTPQWLK